jgi:argininosuccinate lyase
VQDLKPNQDAMRAAANGGYATATDLADWLVRVLGMPFRDAHHVTGSVVAEAERQGLSLDQLPLEALQAIEPRITQDALNVLSVDYSVRSRQSYGGTAPDQVMAQVKRWQALLLEDSKP